MNFIYTYNCLYNYSKVYSKEKTELEKVFSTPSPHSKHNDSQQPRRDKNHITFNTGRKCRDGIFQVTTNSISISKFTSHV